LVVLIAVAAVVTGWSTLRCIYYRQIHLKPEDVYLTSDI
jgi:hypothetical protein